MTKTEHAEYLKGPRWQELRKQVLDDQSACVKCEVPRWLAAIAYDQDLHVHHLSYANKGTDKEIGDLQPLCRRCHDIATFGRSDLREIKSAICITCQRKHWDPYSDLCEICLMLGGYNRLYGKPISLADFADAVDGFSGEPLWKPILQRLYSTRGGTEEIRDELKAEIDRLHESECKSIQDFRESLRGEE